MANLGRKNRIYLVRFRYRGTEYKRSLKTRDRECADAAKNSVELTIHRLHTGLIEVPPSIDPADFIVSGGVMKPLPQAAEPPPVFPTTRALIERYLHAAQGNIAETYHRSQKTHLSHFGKHLKDLLDQPCNMVNQAEVENFLAARKTVRDPSTVTRERNTLMRFYAWVAGRKDIPVFPSPAENLPVYKRSGDRPKFRTIEQINKIIGRGGLSDSEVAAQWNQLFLSPAEIAQLLALVAKRATDQRSFLLHAIPAYSGMRRGEVLRLRWEEVDFESDCLEAISRKQSRDQNETRRQIELHAELKHHLSDWYQQHPTGQFVLSDETLQPLGVDRANRLFWQPLRGTEWCLNSKRNWFKLGFHTYRHSFASNLAAAGIDARHIDEFMGHQTKEMRKRYQHLFPKAKRRAIQCFSLSLPTENPGP